LRLVYPRAFAVFGCVLTFACARPTGQKSSSASPSASASASTSASSLATKLPDRTEIEPTTLLTLRKSAYAASLGADEAAFYLLTDNAAHRLVPGQPPLEIPLDLGIGAALTESSYLYWSKGAIWRAPKQGGKARRIATVPHQPQRLVTSGEHFAWLDRSDQEHFTIQTLQGTKPRIVFASSGNIDAVAMLHDWVFFVERTSKSSWRFGGIRSAGGEPAFSAPRSGRTPAMLAISSDIYYYDGNTIEVHRLSPDFSTEVTVIRKLICSPIAVSVHIYCAQTGGLFEVSKKPGSPPVLIQGRHQGITAVAANSTLVGWIRDLGGNMLAVEMLPLDPPQQSR
jgi:hypothetical protein